MTTRCSRSLWFCLALALSSVALADPELQQRAAKWESYFYPGVEAMKARDLARAEELFWEALREIEPLGATSGAASTLSNLCAVYQLQREYQKAHRMCSNAAGVTQRLRGNVHPELAMDLFQLSQVEMKLEKYDEALQWLTHAIDIMRKTGNGLKPPTRIMLEEFANAWEKKGNAENAAKIRQLIAEARWEAP